MSNKKVNLADALDYLELMLGKDWLEENLKVMKDGQFSKGGFGRNIDFTALGIAYIAQIWYKAREETIDLEIVGGGLPGPHSLHAAATAGDLELLKESAGLKSRLDELKDAKLSLKTVHELGIASGYAQNGYHIDFINPKALAWPSIQGCASPPCAVSTFMARGGGNKAMILCADIHMQDVPGETFPWAKYLQLVQGVQKAGDDTLNQRVLYLHVGDTFAEVEVLLNKWKTHPQINRRAQGYNITVLVYTTGIINITNRPAYVRWGRLVKSNNESFIKNIYVPDEQITAEV